MIVCHNLENRQTMKINAYAGTGKTTTLIAYAAKRMDESFLYIAYNKFVGRRTFELILMKEFL